MTLKPTDNQKRMVDFGIENHYALLCADPRLGKTASSLMIREHFGAKCIVSCPAYLIHNWGKEVEKWFPETRYHIVKTGKDIPAAPEDISEEIKIVILSYGLALKAEHLFSGWADMVICDEIHNLKSMSAKRTQFFHRVIYENSIPHFYGLTGTPIKNRVKEFYSPVCLASYNPAKTDKAFFAKYPDEITFAERFSFKNSRQVFIKTKWGKMQKTLDTYYGIKNSGELKTWLRDKYLRIKASPSDLPPISFLSVYVADFDDSNLIQAFNSYFSSTDGSGSVMPQVKQIAAMKKVEFTIQYAENLLESGTAECILIYSDHVAPTVEIAKHFGVTPITGSTSPSQRARIVDEFQAGRTNVLCATIGSLKEGVNLSRAKDLVLNDPSWVPGDLDQVINRMRVLGDTEPRTVHSILGSPQDMKIMAALEEKRETIRKAE